ncbi:unnamed protein product [Sympodiomycopsis kandeliae]
MQWKPATLLVIAVSALLSLGNVSASSTRSNPLKRVGYATDASIKVVSRRQSTQELLNRASSHPLPRRDSIDSRNTAQVLSSDSIRLSIRAFNQTFFLHLDPNDHIVPPQGARVNVWEWDSTTQQEVLARQEVIDREAIRAYHGVVVHPSLTSRRMHEDHLGVSRIRSGLAEDGILGRAAIMVHDDGSVSGTPKFEGSFDWRGNKHSIKTSRSYQSSRGEHDPLLHPRSLETDALIIHRESDVMSDAEAYAYGLQRRDEDADGPGCGHDSHEFNFNNPLFLSELNNINTSRSPFNFFTPRPSSSLNLFKRAMPWFDLASRDVLSDFGDGPSIVGLPRHIDLEAFEYETEYRRAIYKRQGDALGNGANNSFVDEIGETQGCPNSARVVYVGLASDCTFSSANDGDSAKTSTALLTAMNSVSEIYRNTFNVSLGVVELEVRSATCPSTADSSVPWNVGCSALTMDDRLSAFSQWRGAQPSNGTGLWTLLTTCTSGAEVGVAWLGTLCTASASTSGTDTVTGAAVVADSNRNDQVIAHEIGHVFGAVHDCSSGCSISGQRASQSTGATCCPSSRSSCDDNAAHIMSPVASRTTTEFSSCSIGNICSMLGSGLNTSCVETPGQRKTLSTQSCGNGILEPGEECDAGTNGSSCCSTECKLINGAVCEPSSTACCTSSCQFAPSTKVCRAAKDSSDCDTVEHCTGSSSDCPADEYKDNGTSCGSGSLACANGRCTSRDLQCQRQTDSSNQDFSQACSVRADQSCQLSCQTPGNSNSCTVFQTHFVDGSPCGYGGYCESGSCQSSGWQNTFKSWYRNNLQIAIPVTIVIAVIVIALLWALIRCIIVPCINPNKKRPRGPSGVLASRRRANGQSMPPPPPNRHRQNMSQYAPPPMAPPAHSSGPWSNGGYESYSNSQPTSRDFNNRMSGNGVGQGRGNWVDASAWNGR